MRVAALYDIHGNVPALDAVLQEIRRIEVDLVVVGGDVIPGPMPVETLERLRSLPLPTEFIRGNGEAAVLDEMTGREPTAVPEPYRHVIRWTARQLHPTYQSLLEGWPKTLSLALSPLGRVLFCHATPRNDTEIFTRLTPEQSLVPVFEGIDAQVVVCGHTHMQFERAVGRMRVVNAGSVGMPFGQPGAYWLLLGPDIHFRHTRYEYAQAADEIQATGYPQAQDFAAGNVLKPPSEAEMLERFAYVELT
jgi:putative phosphoesterase